MNEDKTSPALQDLATSTVTNGHQQSREAAQQLHQSHLSDHDEDEDTAQVGAGGSSTSSLPLPSTSTQQLELAWQSQPQLQPPKKKKELRKKPLKEVLQRLLAQFIRRDLYGFFAEPVNVAEVPGYLNVIAEPMDFGTMDTKLSAGLYRDVESFEHDFYLVVRNARAFNPPESIYHQEAQKIEDWATRAIKREAPSAILPQPDDMVANHAGRKASAQPKSSRTKAPSTMTPMAPAESTRTKSSDPRSISPTDAIKTEDDSGSLPFIPFGVRDDSEPLLGLDSRNSPEASFADPSSRRSTSVIAQPRGALPSRHSPTPDHTYDHSTPNLAKRLLGGSSSTGTPASAIPAIYTPTRVKKKGATPATSGLPNLAGPSPLGGTAPSTQEGDGPAAISLLADGSIDVMSLDFDDRRHILLAAGYSAELLGGVKRSQRPPLAPSLDTLGPLPLEGQMHAESLLEQQQLAEAVAGRQSLPDALRSVTTPEPLWLDRTYSHNLAAFPPEQRVLPVTVASRLWGSANLSSEGEVTPSSTPLRWPPLPPSRFKLPPSGNENNDVTSSRLRMREREREKERDAQANLEDWTMLRPKLSRLPYVEDWGLYSSLVPGYEQSNEATLLPSFSSLRGDNLRAAILAELRARSRARSTELNGHQDCARVSDTGLNEAVPQNDETEACISLVGSISDEHMAKRIITDLVYGGEVGLAYAHSVADFVGASSSQHEATYTKANSSRSKPEEALSCSLQDWVREEVVGPLTDGLHSVLQRIGSQLTSPDSEDVRVSPTSAKRHRGPSDDPLDHSRKKRGDALIRKEACVKVEAVEDAGNRHMDDLVDSSEATTLEIPVDWISTFSPRENGLGVQMQLARLRRMASRPVDICALLPDEATSSKDLVDQTQQSSSDAPLRWRDSELSQDEVHMALKQYNSLLEHLSSHTGDVAEQKRKAENLRKAYVALARNLDAQHLWIPATNELSWFLPHLRARRAGPHPHTSEQ